jgi:putative ABC transport system substrate-binding protein
MRRREFLGLLGGATVSSPFNLDSGTLAREIRGVSAMSTVEVIHSGTKGNHNKDHIQALKDGLALGGYGGATVNEHYAKDNTDDLDTIAHNIVGAGGVDVLVAAGGTRSSDAAYKATQDLNQALPVVFTSVANPVRRASNMTGICAQTTKLDGERLRRLSQLLPGKTEFGVLLNTQRQDSIDQKNALEVQAGFLGLHLNYEPINPKSATPLQTQIDGAFQDIQNNIQNNGWGGALVGADPLFNNHRSDVISSASSHKVPTMYQWREFAEDGGLISYGPNLITAYALAGDYVARILAQGAHPDATKLPILPLDNFELVINLKVARTDFNLRVPPTLLAQADRIIVK